MSNSRLETLLTFLKEDPHDSFTRFAIAQEYRKAGDRDNALAFFEGLIRDDPSYIGTYYHLAKLYEEAGRREDAIATYREGITRARVLRDAHAEAELREALLQAEGFGFDD